MGVKVNYNEIAIAVRSRNLSLDKKDRLFERIFNEDSGFTLIEMLVSSFIMVIVLVLTLMVFITYNQSFNATLSMTKAQLQAEGGINDLASMARSLTQCPPSTSTGTSPAAIVYPAPSPAPSNSIELTVPFPKRTFTDASTSTTTDVEVVIVSLDATTNQLTATASACPGFTATGATPSENSVISIDHVKSISYVFYNAKTDGSGNMIWTGSNPPTTSASPTLTTIGIQMTLGVGIDGQNITLQNSGYFVNLFCNNSGNYPPPGAGGCVI